MLIIKDIVEIRIKTREVWVFYNKVDEPLKLAKSDVSDEQKAIIQTFLNLTIE